MKSLLTISFIALFTLLIALTTSCVEKENSKPTSNYEMREMSEMAMLMRQMDAHLNKWKAEITTSQEPISPSPEDFNKIFSAFMTSGFERDEKFEIYAGEFLSAAKKMGKTTDIATTKGSYKSVVDACINCHKDFCTGVVGRLENHYLTWE